MKPDRLELDFMPSRGLAFTRAGAVLAGLALILWATLLVLTYRKADSAAEATEAATVTAQTQAREAETRRAQTAARSAGLWTPAQRAALEAVNWSLGLPWSALIERTARAAPPGVSLLAFEPDVTQAVLILQGEADRASVMVRYVQALERDASLGHALLRDFEAVPDSSRVRFTIEASIASMVRGGRP
jgi:hypothetical protein